MVPYQVNIHGAIGPTFDIDRSKWLVPSDESLIYEQDGVLNFVRQPQGESAGASLVAIPQGQPVREVSFTIELVSYEGDIPGGTGVDVYLEDGRFLSVDVGPGPNGPGVEFSICPTLDAGYEDCDHPEGPRVYPGKPIFMLIAWSNEEVEFYIDGVLHHREPVGRPITEVRFFLYADPGSIFHATIDDVLIVYGD